MTKGSRGLAVVSAVVALSGCVVPLNITLTDDDVHVRGSGRVITVTRSVYDFDAIDARGVATVIVDRTGREAVSITAEDNLIPYLDAEVRGRVLHIGVRSGVQISPRREIVIRVECLEVSELWASGAVAMDADLGWLEALGVSLSGASSLKVYGTVDRQDIDVSGASFYDGRELDSREAHVTASGASSAFIRVSDELYAVASGASVVRYLGSPWVQAHTSGGSTVTRY